MSIEALNFIGSLMKSLSVPYKFTEWKGDIPEYYFTGEYQEVESLTKEENGFQETSFILNGFTRGEWLLLEEVKTKIEKALPKQAMTESGSVVAIFYAQAFPVPTGDAELKRIQINLTIKEWKVD